MTDMSFNYVIPASGTGTIVDVALGVTSGITINWGDLTTTPVTDGTPIVTYSHTYPASALPITYTITISGASLGSFGSSGSILRGIPYLTSVGSFGTLGTTNFTNAFYGATSLTSVPSTLPSSVTNIQNMFRNASLFNQDISGWVVNNVTNMFGVFSGATIFNQNISTWNVTNVNTMRFMFFGSNFNQNISGWNVGNVTNMANMFQGATAFNQNIGTWNVSSATDISNMFNGATTFNNGGQTLAWSSGTGTSNVTLMSAVFQNATAFNQNIGGWNVTNVTSMSGMFNGATAFNNGGAPLTWSSGTGTSKVTNMNSMFQNATAFNQNIGSWNISNVTNMGGMLNSSGLDVTNFNNLLNGWAAQTVKPTVTLGALNMKYTSLGQPGYTTLTTAPNNWTISGATLVTVTYTPTQANSGYGFTLNFTYSGFTIVTGNVYRLTNNAAPSVILSTYTAVPGDTSLTFNNVVLFLGGTNTLTVTNQTTSTTIYNDIQINVSIVCFKEDSKILCFKQGKEQYIPIQNLRKGDLVKTLLHGYVPIELIGKTKMYNKATNERIKDQLYKCTQEQYPEVFEDLVITGCHSILVDEFKDEKERQETGNLNNGRFFATDDKHRLPACVDERTSVYEKEGFFTIYHLALEHDNYYMNYGIYANGLLVETCSKRYLKELSNMELIE